VRDVEGALCSAKRVDARTERDLGRVRSVHCKADAGGEGAPTGGPILARTELDSNHVATVSL
jgi:hypothetical protein